jgi:anaerobic magnesium-protoporphyrin IX monomethyl ester cyclase
MVMNILLVNPMDSGNINTRLPASLNEAQGVYPPLGLAYIAAVLEENNQSVIILDCKALNCTSDDIKNFIRTSKPDIVGITAMSSTLMGALEVAKLAKSAGAVVVMGGSQLAAYPIETLSYEYIDYGIIGEGEYSMLEVIQALESKSDLSSIQGLVYKKDGNIISNGERIVEDIDLLPLPARHLLPMSKYHCVITETPFTTMFSSRGCPSKCGFCFKQPSDKKIRFRNPVKVVEEMEELINKYHVKEIMFYDDSIVINRNHIVGICEEIFNRNLHVKWESPARIDNMDYNLLRMMKMAGCIRLRYGVESGNENILKLMHKGITLDKIREVFKMTHEIGIETFAYFIIGYATETPETIRNTINFAKELNPDWVMFTLATPYPHTDLYELAVKENIINKYYWSDFTLGIRSDRIPYLINNAEDWISIAYKEFYLRPSYILKKLKKLNSIDTLKKYIRGSKD